MRFACIFIQFACCNRFLPPFQYDGSVWPHPQSIRTSNIFYAIDKNINIVSGNSRRCPVIENAVDRYGKLIRKLADSSRKLTFEKRSGVIHTVQVYVAHCEEYPSEHMMESYTLVINNATIKLFGEAEWGVLHGLETLSQLIYSVEGHVGVNETYIMDFPRFAFRGMLIDTSRHFLPISTIKAMISALSWNKMNVLHWHIVDLDSFPYQSTALPELSNLGSYTPFNHVYTQDAIRDLIEYARYRGVRIIPEFDTPGHTESWGPGAGEQFLTKCCNKKGKPDGTVGPIDPSQESNYLIMSTLFNEVKGVFKDNYIHLGGDEVSFKCWKSNPNITTWMAKNNLNSYVDVESVWVNGMIEIVQKLNYKYIVWEEVFSNGVRISDETIVEVWKDYVSVNYKDTLAAVTKAGHRAILAAPWYLNRISYGVDWDQIYVIEPTDFNGTVDQKKLVVGGSAAIWGEYVDGTNVLSRTWPRASAVAERLWSSKNINDPKTAMKRINEWRCRMLARGLSAEPNLANINQRGYHQFGYCPTPFDPFNLDFFW